MSGQKLINLLFYPIMIVCVSISTIASYYGLEQTLGSYTLAGASVICMVLFGSTLAANEAKKLRSSLSGPLLLFCIALVFSTASNFNYFYTRYLALDLARNAYETTVENFKLNIEDAKKRLADDQKLTQVLGLSAKIDALLTNLKAQITDPSRKGVGSRARGIVDDVRRLLPLTDLADPVTNNDEDLLRWFNQLEGLIRANLKNAASDQQKDYLQLVHDMDEAYSLYSAKIEALRRAINAPIYVRELMEEMKRKMTEYTAGVNRIISDGGKAWAPPKDIDPEAGRVGDIVRTIEAVFRTGGNISVAVWSIIVSLFIDLMPITYSFMAVKPESDSTRRRRVPGGDYVITD
jgi:hypothetical protein